MSNPNEDLAYIKDVAEKGRSVPLVGGANFVIWGGVIGTAGLLQYLRGVGVSLPFSSMVMWIGALVLGWILSFFWSSRIRHEEGARSFSNQAAGVAWGSCGVFMTVYFFSLLGAMFFYQGSEIPMSFLFATMFPVAFGIYAIAFAVSATVSQEKWMYYVSLFSLLMMPVMIFTIPHNYSMLLAALGTYGAVMVPGWILWRNQRKASG